MSFSIFHHARVAGISTVVPQNEINIENELEYFGGSLKKAQRATKIIGMHKRRIADPGVTASDLCCEAGEKILTGLSLDRQSIDALIFVSQGPDYSLPATACILQDRLNLSTTCAAFDVNQGCAGFVYGLWLAYSLIESRACSRVLLLVGESLACETDVNNRIIAPIFGDSGTATIVEYTPEENPSWFSLGSDGSGAETLIIPAGGARIPLPKTAKEYEPYCETIHDKNNVPWNMLRTYMDGGAVFDFTLSRVPREIKSLMEYAQISPDDVDFLILHQANKQIIQAIAEKSGFPEDKVPFGTFSKYGNNAGASIPSAICDTFADKLETSTLRLLLCGYGVGLAWASAFIRLDNTWSSGVTEYVTPHDHPTRKQRLDFWHSKLSGDK